MSRGPQPSRRAPTLGVLADWLEGEYQSAVVAGAVEAARESGVNLLLLADSIQRATIRFGERHLPSTTWADPMSSMAWW
jgi:hypothetical protein